MHTEHFQSIRILSLLSKVEKPTITNFQHYTHGSKHMLVQVSCPKDFHGTWSECHATEDYRAYVLLMPFHGLTLVHREKNNTEIIS
jgi:hypothetical protein